MGAPRPVSEILLTAPGQQTEGAATGYSGNFWGVEVAGIEPASSSTSVGLLRAQPAGDCRGRHHCRRLCRPVSDLVSLTVGRSGRSGKPYLMTPVYQPVGLRLDGRRWCLGSVRELRLGVCFWFRLFNVAPETTARFSHIDDQSRNRSPPWGYLHRPGPVGRHSPPSLPAAPHGPAPALVAPSGLSRRRRSVRRCGRPGPPRARRRGPRWPGACRGACAPGPGPAGPWPCRP